jgi:hypothetical protein
MRGLGRISSRDLKGSAVSVLAGAVGAAATTAILRRVLNIGPLARIPMWGRALIEAALGFGLFFPLQRVDGQVAAGWAGGVGGFGVATFALGFFDQPVSLGGATGRLRLRGLRGASVESFRPGQPRLAPAAKPSPLAGVGGVVITQRQVPAYLS